MPKKSWAKTWVLKKSMVDDDRRLDSEVNYRHVFKHENSRGDTNRNRKRDPTRTQKEGSNENSKRGELKNENRNRKEQELRKRGTQENS